MRLFVALLLATIAVELSYGTVITVPGDFSQIQSAIDVSASADTVLVSPGIYNENINFLGKAIVVKSTEGAYTTVIDAGGSGSVVKFTSSETRNSILDGFTLQNGTGTFISPYYYGGGINCTTSSPTIRNNIIRNNTGLSGGGVLCYIGGCPLIENNVIENNTADNYGAGIYITSSSVEVTGSIIRNNIAGSGAGITSAYNSSCTASNSLIYGNEASKGAGLMGLINATFNVQNCTVVDNSGTTSSGGMYGYNSSFTVTNSIFWGNTAPSGSQCTLYNGSGSFSWSDFQGGEASILMEGSASVIWGDGMAENDPFFETGSLSDYHLGTNSLCIDGGNPSSQFNDTEDPANPGNPLWPALGTLTCDMGVYGGLHGGGSVEIEHFAEEVSGYAVKVALLENPVNGYVSFICSFPEGQTGELYVFDAAGRLVAKEPGNAPGAGTLNICGLNTGIHLLRLVTPSGTSTTRFILLDR